MNLGQLADDARRRCSGSSAACGDCAERAALEQRSGDRAELAAEWLVATQSLASALCAAAELYMTDMCDEPEAEERCEALATEAVGLVSGLDSQTLAEPYQTLASLRLSQQRPEEAHPLVRKALGVVNDAEEGRAERRARAAIAKLCMEVGESDDAVELLQALRVEDEDSLESGTSSAAPPSRPTSSTWRPRRSPPRSRTPPPTAAGPSEGRVEGAAPRAPGRRRAGAAEGGGAS